MARAIASGLRVKNWGEHVTDDQYAAVPATDS